MLHPVLPRHQHHPYALRHHWAEEPAGAVLGGFSRDLHRVADARENRRPGGHLETPGRGRRPGRPEGMPLRAARGLHRLRRPPHQLPVLPAGGGLARLQGRPRGRRVLLHGARGALPRVRGRPLLDRPGVAPGPGGGRPRPRQRPVGGPDRPQALVPAEHALDRAGQADVLPGELQHRQVPRLRLRELVSAAHPGGGTDLEPAARRRRGAAGIRPRLAQRDSVQGQPSDEGAQAPVKGIRNRPARQAWSRFIRRSVWWERRQHAAEAAAKAAPTEKHQATPGNG